MNLIPNWPQAWRMYSMQALAIVAALQAALLALPPELLAQEAPFVGMPWSSVGTALTVAAALLGALGRVLDQPGLAQPASGE